MKNINEIFKTANKNNLIDIRENEEWDEAHIKNTTHVVKSELEDNPSKYLKKDETYYIFCRSGKRASETCNVLQNKGYDVECIGGILDYDGELIANEYELDLSNLQCPQPLIQTTKKLSEMKNNDVVTIKATDIGFLSDMISLCAKNNNKILHSSSDQNSCCICIKKIVNENDKQVKKDAATIILFSGEYDKAIAALIIASGAAAMGKKTTVFATFWGLNALKDETKPKVKKDFMGSMFSKMLPKSMNKLPLSSMNYFGMGRKMIEHVMKQKNVDNLETLYKTAIDNGVEFIACSMSMDVMSISQEELYDNVKIGGVATYLSESENANLTLFI